MGENSRFKTALCFSVQSVCLGNYSIHLFAKLGSKYILAGTKSGDIYEVSFYIFVKFNKKLDIPEESGVKSTEDKNYVVLKSNAVDHEPIKQICFSPTSDKLYTITKNGFFNVWFIETYERIFCYDFN